MNCWQRNNNILIIDNEAETLRSNISLNKNITKIEGFFSSFFYCNNLWQS